MDDALDLLTHAVDLMATKAYPDQFITHPQVFRVIRVRLQSSLGLELGIEHYIAGMVEAAKVDTDLQVRHARDTPT
ncbi:hypothetical protein D9M71_517990 [compost metagenome]